MEHSGQNMNDKIRIGNKSDGPKGPVESFADIKARKKNPDEVKAIVEALMNSTEVSPSDYERVLEGMGITTDEYQPFLKKKEEPMAKSHVEPPKKTSGNYKLNNIRTAEKLFEAPTQILDLPSKGMFYPNGQSQLKVKALTATEDDILFTPELITQNKVLHAVLDSAVIDDTLRPENMLACDRSYVLIQLRMDGFGNEYEPGPMTCDNCGNVYSPKVDLSLLKVKTLTHAPDSDGMYFVELPMSKVKIRFRLLNGKDELALQNKGMAAIKKNSGFKSKKLWSERYLLQIMEVNGEADKIFIKSFIDAMPLGDSQFFRKYAFEVEPGIDLNYNFICPHCGYEDEKLVPITPRLFYPDADI
jgi:hypothetical protein